jgi:small subunit ribosomal protein S1
VSEAEDIKMIAKAIEKVKEGEVYDGKVSMIANFGAFVAIDVTIGKPPVRTSGAEAPPVRSKTLGSGGDKVTVEGLVHISRYRGVKPKIFEALKRISYCKVIGKKDGRLSLSIKQAKSDPWATVASKFKKDEKYKGIITKVSDYGVFVALEEGVEGLIHITKIPPGMDLRVKDEVNVIVEEIDPENKKISLGLVLTVMPVGYK